MGIFDVATAAIVTAFVWGGVQQNRRRGRRDRGRAEDGALDLVEGDGLGLVGRVDDLRIVITRFAPDVEEEAGKEGEDDKIVGDVEQDQVGDALGAHDLLEDGEEEDTGVEAEHHDEHRHPLLIVELPEDNVAGEGGEELEGDEDKHANPAVRGELLHADEVAEDEDGDDHLDDEFGDDSGLSPLGGRPHHRELVDVADDDVCYRLDKDEMKRSHLKYKNQSE